eukprot:Hpha_TRINITY_DN14541_c0_g1::TRINITY_DN14541_c0_g1_i3::g.46834::m.46834
MREVVWVLLLWSDVVVAPLGLRAWASRIQHWGGGLCTDPLEIGAPDFGLVPTVGTTQAVCVETLANFSTGIAEKTGTWAEYGPEIGVTDVEVSFQAWESDCFLCVTCDPPDPGSADCITTQTCNSGQLTVGVGGEFTCGIQEHNVTVNFEWVPVCLPASAPAITGGTVDCLSAAAEGDVCTASPDAGNQCTGEVRCSYPGEYTSTLACWLLGAPPPSLLPSIPPSISPPTFSPTLTPLTSQPSTNPSHSPTVTPSVTPSRQPSTKPSTPPSTPPSVSPLLPSVSPSAAPTQPPTQSPAVPTIPPSSPPSPKPTVSPSARPST